MPHVHFSHASLSAHQSTQPSLATPLPQLKPLPDLKPGPDGLPRYSVVICGAGPAGIFSALLLTRYGIPSPHILCIDASTTRTAGHADGIFARNQEVLDSLGLMGEIDKYAGEVRENAQWGYHAPKGEEGNGVEPNGGHKGDQHALKAEEGATSGVSPGHLADKVDVEGGIKREDIRPFTTVTSRFKAAFRTFPQGRVERILDEDMLRHGGHPVVRGMKVVDVKIDKVDADFPVLATLEDIKTGETKSVRCKYLIGADGAHSAVRRSLGIKMEGSTLDDIWGVMDFVPDTDFPDIRRVALVNHPHTFMLHVPREVNSQGERLSRMYVLFNQDKNEEEVKNGLKASVEDQEVEREKLEAAQRALKKSITLERILEKAKEILSPYKVDFKAGTEVDWWAAYQVGQRVAEKMIVPDWSGHPRVFLMGDASHTHSPKLGQGMNVSMMDAYDLSWKLSHALLGSAPSPQELLKTYEIDRRDNAWNLIDMDKRWYNARYGKNQEKSKETEDWITPKWDEIRLEMASFITGTSVEYEAGTFSVDPRRRERTGQSGEVDGYSMGVLREGRRLADDSTFTRFVDGIPVDLQKQCTSNGSFRIIVFAPANLFKRNGLAQQTLVQICKILQAFPDKMVQLMVMFPMAHPRAHLSFEWSDLPHVLREEVHSYLLGGDESTYRKYGVNMEEGVVAIVRPDQYIGSTADLAVGAKGTEKIERYLRRMLVPKP